MIRTLQEAEAIEHRRSEHRRLRPHASYGLGDSTSSQSFLGPRVQPRLERCLVRTIGLGQIFDPVHSPTDARGRILRE
jgi:hypothetical protein